MNRSSLRLLSPNIGRFDMDCLASIRDRSELVLVSSRGLLNSGLQAYAIFRKISCSIYVKPKEADF